MPFESPRMLYNERAFQVGIYASPQKKSRALARTLRASKTALRAPKRNQGAPKRTRRAPQALLGRPLAKGPKSGPPIGIRGDTWRRSGCGPVDLLFYFQRIEHFLQVFLRVLAELG